MEQALTRSSRPNPGFAAIRTSLQPLEIPGSEAIPLTGNPFAAHQAAAHEGAERQGATSPGVINQVSAQVAVPPSLVPPGAASAVGAPIGPVPTAAGRTSSRHTPAGHDDAGRAEFSLNATPGSAGGSAAAFSREADPLQHETPSRDPQRRTAPRQAIVQGPSITGGDPLVEGLGLLAGVTIGMLTLLVPLLSVISDRPAGSGLSAEPAASSGRHR